MQHNSEFFRGSNVKVMAITLHATRAVFQRFGDCEVFPVLARNEEIQAIRVLGYARGGFLIYPREARNTRRSSTWP